MSARVAFSAQSSRSANSAYARHTAGLRSALWEGVEGKRKRAVECSFNGAEGLPHCDA
jgi:hypothetical protein